MSVSLFGGRLVVREAMGLTAGCLIHVDATVLSLLILGCVRVCRRERNGGHIYPFTIPYVIMLYFS